MKRTKQVAHKLTNRVVSVVASERGEGILGALGWGVVVVTLVVAAHGLFTGWLPDFIQTKILDRINNL